MDKELRAAFIISQSACAVIRALGMSAENEKRQRRGESPAYTEENFCAIIDEYGIGWNVSLTYLRD